MIARGHKVQHAIILAVLQISAIDRGSFTYRRASSDALEEAILIKTPQFSPAELSRSEPSLHSRCKGYRMAQLTLAPTEVELMRSINSNLPHLTVAGVPQIARHDFSLGLEKEPLRTAAVFCSGNNVALYVRDGGKVSSSQLHGSRDPRVYWHRGVKYTQVGLRLHIDPSAVNRLRPILWIYFTVEQLPSIQEANSLRTYLQAGLAPLVCLVIRTDSHFFNYSGPRVDHFETRPIVMTASQFMKSSHILCAGIRSARCRLLTTPLTDSAHIGQ